MPPGRSAPPRVTRETRLLLITALASVVVLWGLARVRFPERAVSSTLPPVLTQLAPRSPLDEIPAVVADLIPRLDGWATVVRVDAPHGGRPAEGLRSRAAFRIADDLAVLLLEDGVPAGSEGSIVVRDRASGLAVMRVEAGGATEPPAWSQRRLDVPRFLIEADASAAGVSLRPVFVSGLIAEPSALWGGAIWNLPGAAGLRAGSAALTPEGSLLGLVVRREEDTAIVPWQAVQARMERLLREPPPPPVRLGLDVQPVTPAIAAATGARGGVIVARVEPDGAAAPILEPADVIETADDAAIMSIEDWRGHAARLEYGEALTLGIRRGGEAQQVRLAPPRDDEAPAGHLGLTLRTLSGTGAEVLRVLPASAAARAGLRSGDVITFFGGTRAPTAAQITRGYAVLVEDRPILLVVARGEASVVLTMTRRP